MNVPTKDEDHRDLQRHDSARLGKFPALLVSLVPVLTGCISGTDNTEAEDHTQVVREVQEELKGRVVRVAKEIFVREHDTRCIDGRCTEAVVGEPAGTEGRIIDEMQTIFEMTGRYPTQEELHTFIASLDVINVHTDGHGMEALEDYLTHPKTDEHSPSDAALQEHHKKLKQLVSDEEIGLEKLLQNGTNDETLNRTFALAMLQKIGCGYLKAMYEDACTNNAALYGIPRVVIEDVFVATMQAKWKNAQENAQIQQQGLQVNLSTLSGPHRENKVFRVIHTVEAIEQELDILMLQPNTGNDQAFEVDLAVSQWLAQHHDVKHWEQAMDISLNHKEFGQKLSQWRARHTEEIRKKLASKLPIFDVKKQDSASSETD